MPLASGTGARVPDHDWTQKQSLAAGRRSHVSPRLAEAEARADYTAQLSPSDYRQLKWPKGEDSVYVHAVSTPLRKLYCCPAVIVRPSLDAPIPQARSLASRDLVPV